MLALYCHAVDIDGITGSLAKVLHTSNLKRADMKDLFLQNNIGCDSVQPKTHDCQICWQVYMATIIVNIVSIMIVHML